jgi:hypothetical protein
MNDYQCNRMLKYNINSLSYGKATMAFRGIHSVLKAESTVKTFSNKKSIAYNKVSLLDPSLPP